MVALVLVAAAGGVWWRMFAFATGDRSALPTAGEPLPVTTAELELASMPSVYADLAAARTITVSAFALEQDSPMTRALEQAVSRGAAVSVALDRGFGFYVSENAKTAAKLTRAGVRVHIVGGPGHSTHLKAAVLDGALYLCDRNWPTSNQAETIVIRDSVPGDRVLVERAILGETDGNDHLWTRKSEALEAEARLITNGAGKEVDVATESFGEGTPVFAAMTQRAVAGAVVRLLVSSDEYGRSSSERAAIAKMERSGVQVRVSGETEKYAVVDSAAWVGSANQTRGLPNQADFGVLMADAFVARRLLVQFESEWARAGAPSE